MGGLNKQVNLQKNSRKRRGVNIGKGKWTAAGEAAAAVAAAITAAIAVTSAFRLLPHNPNIIFTHYPQNQV